MVYKVGDEVILTEGYNMYEYKEFVGTVPVGTRCVIIEENCGSYKLQNSVPFTPMWCNELNSVEYEVGLYELWDVSKKEFTHVKEDKGVTP